MGRVTDDEIARLDWHKGVLPPGPYRVEWPAEQGGAFTLWGRQGTPPDFKDGWAIPLVASGVDTAMYALRDILNGRSPGGPGMTSERREGGWEELRREIEALPTYRAPFAGAVDRYAVLAIVDRLAAARGEPPEEAESLLVEAMDRGWINPGTRTNQPDDPWLVWQMRYANLRLAAARGEPALAQNPDVPWRDETLYYPAAARGEPEIERLRKIEHAARDVDGLWSEARTLIHWQGEAGEALRDLRTALEMP